MTAKYMLPCGCGRKVAVRARQAGETVRCACGQQLEVPSMRGLAKLAHADEPDVAASWSQRQGVLFVGLVVGVLALAGVGYLALQVPKLDTSSATHLADIRRQLDDMPMDNLWGMWQYMQLGIRGIETPDTSQQRQALELARARMWQLGIVGAIGLAAAAAAWFAGQQSPRRR